MQGGQARLTRDEAVHVRRALACLQLDDHATFEDLAQRVAAKAERPITIQAKGDETWDTVTAVLGHLSGGITILVRSTDSAVYQLHGVLHEFGHILLGHDSCFAYGEISPRDDRERMAEGAAFELARLIYLPREDLRVFG